METILYCWSVFLSWLELPLNIFGYTITFKGILIASVILSILAWFIRSLSD